MPHLTRWFIKASLVALILAFVSRALISFLPGWGYPSAAAALAPVFLHLFMWGWLTQIVFGMAYWMFPKYSQARPRGFETLWTLTFWCFNIGLFFRVIGEPLHLLRPEALWAWLTAAAAVLQWLAGLFFVVNIWGRVKER